MVSVESDKNDGDETPDPPVIANLKKLDDRYLEIYRELEKEVAKLEQRRDEKLKPILDQRAQLLLGENSTGDVKTGTPALQGFWLEALSNHEELEDIIYEWDRPVLEYLRDVIVKPLVPENRLAGFRYTFHFVENPYFEDASLSVEHHMKEKSPYRGDDDKAVLVETRGCSIKWKKGKDVTVERVAPKVGKDKKAKAGKATEEARDSFFRDVFRTMKEDSNLPVDFDLHQFLMTHGDSDDMDESEVAELYLHVQRERGAAIRQVVSHAVRWYTGEACPDDDDEDEDDEEESDEGDDDDDDGEDEDEDAGKEKPKKGKLKEAEHAKAESDQKTEECKQQ